MHGDLSRKEKMLAFFLGLAVGLVLLVVVLYPLPAVQERVGWRVDFALTYLRGLIDPVQPIPTALAASGEAPGEDPLLLPGSPTPTATALPPTEAPAAHTSTPTATPPPTLTPTPLPDRVELAAPRYEKQELNNCGPATLSMHLNFYGWQGDQTTISSEIKPKREDRNVNVEELVGYVNTRVPGITIQYRVGGDIDTLRRLLAAGYPVTIEEEFIMAESYWLNDDRWAGHYLLLTGYDDARQEFIAQDVFVAPNIRVSYQALDQRWKTFNRVYMVLYPAEQQEEVKVLLGDQWDVDANRQYALDRSIRETEADSTDSYAWFNRGTNLVYFERYSQAAQAYDQARQNGLPQRMLRYQFGPFFAYFHTHRMDDLLALTEYALKRTPNSEEALLWRGWAMYRKGNREEALKLFQEALDARPGYPDAQYALNFVVNN